MKKENFIETLQKEITSVEEDKSIRAGDISFDNFKEAFLNCPDGKTITLLNDVTINEHLYLNNGNKITIDLNGHTLKEEECSIIVVKGNLTIDNGLIYHTGDNNQALKVVASTEAIKDNAVLNLEPNLRIYSPSDYGVSISPQATNKDPKGQYGAVINCNCEIRSYYVPLYVNGFILKQTNDRCNCAINIGSCAKIICTGTSGDMTVGLYGAGYADYRIANGAYIKGLTGIEIRAGNLVVDDAQIFSTGGLAKTAKNNSGNASKGCGLAIIQHTSKQPISVIINGGYFKGAVPFLEENTEGNENIINDLNVSINNGIFEISFGSDGDSVYAENLTSFISGGTFIPSADEKYMKQ